MRIFRSFTLALACAMILCGLFTVSAFAASYEEYSYAGVVLPKLPDDEYTFYRIGLLDGQYYCWVTPEDFDCGAGGLSNYNKNGHAYYVNDGEWVYYGTETLVDVMNIWADHDLTYQGTKFVTASDPVVTIITIPDPPPSIEDFLSGAGQIFTSAISWVGNVGSTILQQPLLLAFCALPLCGIGIGVFRRLRGID